MVGGVVLACGHGRCGVWPGYDRPLIFVGLFLLGLGWNIGLIAGSSLVTSSVRAERVEVQGTADLMMSFCGGCAAFGSGFVKQAWGFHLLANAASLDGAGAGRVRSDQGVQPPRRRLLSSLRRCFSALLSESIPRRADLVEQIVELALVGRDRGACRPTARRPRRAGDCAVGWRAPMWHARSSGSTG